MIATLLLALSAAPGLAAQEPENPPALSPGESYEAWWASVAARPLPALRTGFVLEGKAVAEESAAPVFSMRVEGTLHYLDSTHVRVDGELTVSADDGTRAGGRFRLLVAGERMYMTGSLEARDGDAGAREALEGAASISTAKLQQGAWSIQETYRALGMEALGLGPSLLDQDVGAWMHPVLAARSTMEQLRVQRFELDAEEARCTMAIDVAAFRQAMDAAMGMTGVDEEPELQREFEAEMEPLLTWLEGLSFDMALDRQTGLPRPFHTSLSLPTLMLGEGAPPVTLTASGRLVDTVLTPEFADDLFVPPADVTWLDLDPFLDMALGAMQAMVLDMEAEMDAEF